MTIIPAIDIIDGKCVRLTKGDYETKKIYNENEITILRENTEIMQLWMKNNPKKAEDFLRFKEGFEARKEYQ